LSSRYRAEALAAHQIQENIREKGKVFMVGSGIDIDGGIDARLG
jgi:hypothetical protein